MDRKSFYKILFKKNGMEYKFLESTKKVNYVSFDN